MPARERERVLRVKRGDVAVLADVEREIDDVRDTVEGRLRPDDTPLRPEADLAAVSEWATNAHRRHWGWL